MPELRWQKWESGSLGNEGLRFSDSLIREEEEGSILALPKRLATLAELRRPDWTTGGAAKLIKEIARRMKLRLSRIKGGDVSPFFIGQAGQGVTVPVIPGKVAVKLVAGLVCYDVYDCARITFV